MTYLLQDAEGRYFHGIPWVGGSEIWGAREAAEVYTDEDLAELKEALKDRPELMLVEEGVA